MRAMGGAALVAAMMTACAAGSASAGRDPVIEALLARLHAIAAPVVESARIVPGGKIPGLTNTTPYTLRMPGGNAGYPAFWVRDAAMMLGADFIGAEEVEGWIRLIASVQAGPEAIRLANGLTVPPWSIPDHITLQGSPCWYPGAYDGPNQGDGTFGFLPPADDAYELVRMAREQLRLSGSTAFLKGDVEVRGGRSGVWEMLDRAFAGVEAGPDGLVVCSAEEGRTRVDWGFCDTVRKTGSCLMPSLLRWRAANEMSEIARALGRRADAARYRAVAAQVKRAVPAVFLRDMGEGRAILLSATGKGKRDDVWASAYAVWLGILPAGQRDAVARGLLHLYRQGGTVLEGQVRALPPDGPFGGFWDQTVAAPGTYQNGAFWGTPTGWMMPAVYRADREAGRRMLREFVESVEANRAKGAPWECFNPEKGHYQNPLYCATVALTASAIRHAIR